MAFTTRRRILATLGGAASVVALGMVLNWPVTTRQGIGYEVSTFRLPLYVKAGEFVTRSARYRALARRIVAGAVSDEARMLAVFEWTRRNVRDVPHGFPVVDDHIFNIITRGYGAADQKADVFATLTTYAGVPAFWSRVPADEARPGVLLTFAEIDGRWRVLDPAHGMVYRTAGGALATLEEICCQSELVPEALRRLAVDGSTYGEILAGASMPDIPRPLRAEMQMPLPRAWHELKIAIGVESDDEP